MKHYLLCLTGFLSIVLTSSVTAVRMQDIYNASVPVTSQSQTDRAKILSQAMAQVFVKITGNTKILDNTSIKNSLNKAENYIQEYSYARSAQPDRPYTLEVKFDPSSINKLLRNSAAPIWGSNRPLIMIWAETELTNHSPEIINNDPKNEIQTLLKAQASLRGLPIALPAMDGMDQNNVNIEHINTMATAYLQAAAKRYSADGVLVMRINENPTTGFTAQAKLQMGNDQWDFEVSAKTLQEVLSIMIDNTTDKLAGKYATVVSNNIQNKITLKIAGVTEQTDFSQLIRYLKHLPPVANLQITEISNDQVTLSISLRGSIQGFSQMLSMGNRLALQTTEPADQAVLAYLWNH